MKAWSARPLGPTTLLALLFGLPALASQSQILQDASRLEVQGQFKMAATCLERALENPSLSPADRSQLLFERDRLDRIKIDFPLTKEALFDDLRKAVKGLTSEEFEAWISEGRFDSRTIDRELRFMVSSVSNLFWRYPELSRRRLPPKNSAAYERRVLESCESIRSTAVRERRPYVLPKQFEVAMTVTAQPNAAPDGQTVRAWLPIPREFPFQSGYQLIASSTPVLNTDPPHSTIRSVLLEQAARKDRPTPFRIQYRYTSCGVWFDLKAQPGEPLALPGPELRKYTSEAPHIVFTTEMRSLSEKIAAGETNPCLKARRFYNWIAENIKYSYAVEYSTIRNLGDYCRDRGYGDCGQEALLFMTLCRLNGIPARWQSGWSTFPGAKSIHDWTEIYVAPHGWVPVDPYMGIFAMRYATSLKTAQRLKIRDFYFGGLDQYRLSANSDHNQELSPPKKSMRSDPVDFQRGELEWNGQNIYLDKYSWNLTVTERGWPPGHVE